MTPTASHVSHGAVIYKRQDEAWFPGPPVTPAGSLRCPSVPRPPHSPTVICTGVLQATPHACPAGRHEWLQVLGRGLVAGAPTAARKRAPHPQSEPAFSQGPSCSHGL